MSIYELNLSSSNLNGIYSDISEVIGVDITILLFKYYKGLQVTFPTRLLSKEYVKEQIKKEFDGANTKELARRYAYSERWIRQMIAE